MQACDDCHSDSTTKFGSFPCIIYPRVPSHEVAGVVDAVAPDVPLFKPGQCVALGRQHGL
jgi:D-arabinose 1-dehydrogenase-like Zn-dependent alcohol dehydrogenase